MNNPFRWRDLRDFSIGLDFWPFHWWPLWMVTREDDESGGLSTLTIGPLVLRFSYNAHDGPFAKPYPLYPEEG